MLVRHVILTRWSSLLLNSGSTAASIIVAAPCCSVRVGGVGIGSPTHEAG